MKRGCREVAVEQAGQPSLQHPLQPGLPNRLRNPAVWAGQLLSGAHLAGAGVVVPLLQVLVGEELEAGIRQDAAVGWKGCRGMAV